MALEKRETRVEARVSFYEGQGFGTARQLIRTQVYDGETPIGGPSEEWRKIDDMATLRAILGDELAQRRGQLDEIRATHDAEMGKLAEEKRALEKQLEEVSLDRDQFKSMATQALEIITNIRTALGKLAP